MADTPVRGRRAFSAALAALLAAAGPTPLAAHAQADVAGTWAGSGRFSNDWPSLPCQYLGRSSPPSVTLELTKEGSGSVSIDVPAPAGSKCPPLHKRWAIRGVSVTGASVSFRDPGGHEWNLALRDDLLRGIVAWKQGPGEPLAEGGVAAAGGEVPQTRLSGEVALDRKTPLAAAQAKTPSDAVPAGGAAVGASAGEARRGGGAIRGVGAVIAANVVGVGGLLLANNLLQDSQSITGVVTGCSLRSCFAATQGDCANGCSNNTVLARASCGNVPGGVPIHEACSIPERPCQANLSCTNGFCEDQAGLCPF